MKLEINMVENNGVLLCKVGDGAYTSFQDICIDEVNYPAGTIFVVNKNGFSFLVFPFGTPNSIRPIPLHLYSYVRVRQISDFKITISGVCN